MLGQPQQRQSGDETQWIIGGCFAPDRSDLEVSRPSSLRCRNKPKAAARGRCGTGDERTQRMVTVADAAWNPLWSAALGDTVALDQVDAVPRIDPRHLACGASYEWVVA